MRLVHNWADDSAKNVKAQYGLRKEYVSAKHKKPGSKMDYHKTKACPVDGCKAVTKVMSRHLKKSHNISPNDPQYKVLLKRAITIDHRKKKQAPEKMVAMKQTLIPLLLQEDDLSSDSEDSSFQEDVPVCNNNSEHSTTDEEPLDDDSSQSSYSSNASQESVSSSSDVRSNKAIAKDL